MYVGMDRFKMGISYQFIFPRNFHVFSLGYIPSKRKKKTHKTNYSVRKSAWLSMKLLNLCVNLRLTYFCSVGISRCEDQCSLPNLFFLISPERLLVSCVSSSIPECKLHENGTFLVFGLLCIPVLTRCLAQSRSSVSICNSMNKKSFR